MSKLLLTALLAGTGLAAVSAPAMAKDILDKLTVADGFSISLFADDVENFTGFAKGELLAIDGQTRYEAEVDGEAIIFPNADVALGQRALLTVIPMQVDSNFI